MCKQDGMFKYSCFQYVVNFTELQPKHGKDTVNHYPEKYVNKY